VLVQDVAAGDKLNSGRGGLDPNEDPRWTVVTNVPNAIIGNLLKSQLEDAGIPVFMQRSPSADIAYFSHNDYVPHDLRVPFAMVEDARRILESGPDHDPGSSYWEGDTGYADYQEEDWEETGEPPYTPLGGPPAKLPEGWTLLPTERDLHAGRHYRPSHKDAEGWYRADSAGGFTFGKGGAAAEQPEYDFDEEPLEADKARYSSPHGRDSYGEGYGSSDRSKWIRIIYGILLLVMSLPFLLQLLQQIASFLHFGR
jgi:hypothetical protein